MLEKIKPSINARNATYIVCLGLTLDQLNQNLRGLGSDIYGLKRSPTSDFCCIAKTENTALDSVLERGPQTSGINSPERPSL